jgi:flagellar secretion chaperone FliS
MTTLKKYQAYASATQTVAKTKQIVMLYDGAIRYIQQAKEAIREKRIEDRYRLLVKTGEIINGLQACLDFENGKEIARVLYQFYSSIDNRLFGIHRSNSIEECDEVIAELKQMREVWHEIDQGNIGETPANTNIAPAADAPENPGPNPDKPISVSA